MYGTRIVAGVVQDPAGLPLSKASSSQGVPAIATNGTDYLVVWNDTRTGTADVFGARVTAAGVVLDTAGFPIANGPIRRSGVA